MIETKKNIRLFFILAVLFLLIYLATVEIANQPSTNNNTVLVNQTNSALDTYHAHQIQNNDYILYQNALGYQTNKFCNTIQNETLKQKCMKEVPDGELPPVDNRSDAEIKDEFYYQNAVAYKNSVFCNQIKNNETKQKCINEIPKKEPANNTPPTQPKQTSTNDSQTQDSTTKDTFYYQNAVAYKNPAFCDQIKNNETKQKCINEVSAP